MYSLEDVTWEIKDKATRQRLQVLPYRINYKEPSKESLHAGNYRNRREKEKRNDGEREVE